LHSVQAGPPVRRRPGAFSFLLIIGALAGVMLPACRRSTESSPLIRLAHAGTNPSATTIEITGLSSDELSALRARTPTPAEWQAIVRVTVVATRPTATPPPPAMPGCCRFTRSADRGIVFTPMFGLKDPGQPCGTLNHRRRPAEVVSLPKPNIAPTTVVSHVYPSADTVPENQLRLYVHFSAPMGRRGGLDYIRLLDAAGQEVKGAFLPLDAEFWNGDRTRFTVFFDPGRVKRGVKPNEDLGRSLTAGQRYTLVVSRAWPDAQGVPLKEEFRRTFSAAPADTRRWIPRPSAWRLPAAHASFDGRVSEALDHGLWSGRWCVGRGAAVNGESAVDPRNALDLPREPWPEGNADCCDDDPRGSRGQPDRARVQVDRFDRVEPQTADTINCRSVSVIDGITSLIKHKGYKGHQGKTYWFYLCVLRVLCVESAASDHEKPQIFRAAFLTTPMSPSPPWRCVARSFPGRTAASFRASSRPGADDRSGTAGPARLRRLERWGHTRARPAHRRLRTRPAPRPQCRMIRAAS
jgi:hypothetical protein